MNARSLLLSSRSISMRSQRMARSLNMKGMHVNDGPATFIACSEGNTVRTRCFYPLPRMLALRWEVWGATLIAASKTYVPLQQDNEKMNSSDPE